jgi:hypothetical protein
VEGEAVTDLEYAKLSEVSLDDLGVDFPTKNILERNGIFNAGEAKRFIDFGGEFRWFGKTRRDDLIYCLDAFLVSEYWERMADRSDRKRSTE